MSNPCDYGICDSSRCFDSECFDHECMDEVYDSLEARKEFLCMIGDGVDECTAHYNDVILDQAHDGLDRLGY